MASSSPSSKGRVETLTEPNATERPDSGPFELGPTCPSCSEPWLRPTQLPGRYRCVYCLTRFQLMAYCPACGEHSTIVRMSDTEELTCVRCGGSMLKPV
jgi:Zn ribbon nucleic-acid-binding protein